MSVQTKTAWIAGPPFAVTYAEVQQFYARQMQFADAGAADEWAATFTPDGVFVRPAPAEPARGRAVLAAELRKAATALAGNGVQHRHWLGMMAVEPQDDGTLHVRCYAQVIATPRDGQPRLHAMCVCDDVLVRVDGELLVQRRQVSRDDQA